VTILEGQPRIAVVPGSVPGSAQPDGADAPAPQPDGTDSLESTDGLAREVAGLQEALASRTVISYATGIIAGRLDVPTSDAWEILRRASTNTNIKLRHVAHVVVSWHDDQRDPEDDHVAARIAPILGPHLLTPALTTEGRSRPRR
jgi:hypothetical protein